MFSVGARSEFLLHMAGLSCEQLRRRPGRMAAVRAKVKGWEIIDGEEESLADPERGGGWIRFVVEPSEGTGCESFDVLLCTPGWLEDEVERVGPVIGCHRLMIYPLDLWEAARFLAYKIEEQHARDWPTLCKRLTRIGRQGPDSHQGDR